jgi:hypothetical protein
MQTYKLSVKLKKKEIYKRINYHTQLVDSLSYIMDIVNIYNEDDFWDSSIKKHITEINELLVKVKEDVK